MRLLALLPLIFIWTSVAFGQNKPQPSFTNYSGREGLPSSEVYSVIQDRRGYIWFGTDRGVARFNGYEFELFSTSNGLIDDVVFNVYEDYKGRIWFLALNYKLCYWEDGKIIHYPHNDVIVRNMDTQVRNFYESFYIDKNDNVYLSTPFTSVLQISKSGAVVRSGKESSIINRIQEIDGQLILDRMKDSVQTNIGGFYFRNREFQIPRSNPLRMKFLLLNERTIVTNNDQSIFVYDIATGHCLQSIEFSNRIAFLSMIEGKLFVGIVLDGLRLFDIDKNNKLSESLHLLEGKSVTSAIKDRHDGYWFTTTESGAYYTPNINLLSFSESNGLTSACVKDMKSFGKKLFMGEGTYTYLYDLDNKSAGISPLPYHPAKWKKFTIINSNLQISNGRTVLDLKSGQIFPYKHLCSIGAIIPYDSLYYVTVSNAVFTIIKGEFKLLRKYPELTKINSAVCIGKDAFLFGTESGLFKIQGSKVTHLSALHPLLQHGIVQIISSKRHGYILATRNAGVLLYKNGKVKSISKKNGLVSDNISTIFLDQDENIWVGTNLGLDKIHGDQSGKIDHYSIVNGLISNEITSIICVDDHFFIGTKRGVSILNSESQHSIKHRAPPIITEVSLNGKRINLKKIIHIYPEDKFIDISYISLYYAAPHQIEYRYRIKGSSNQWHYTKDRSTHLESFPDRGSYTIELYARTGPNQPWTACETTITLQFHPPFYKSWPFRVGIVLLLGLLIYLGFKVRLLRYDKHIQQEISDRLLTRLGKKSYLVIEIDKRKIRINQSSILYVQSFKDYCEIKTAEEKYLYRSTMKKMEEILPSLSFIRVHRSYLVRKDKIDSIGKDLITINGTEIPIGKTYRSRVAGLKKQFSRLNS